MDRGESTARGYLQEYIRHRKIRDSGMWVNALTAASITKAAKQFSLQRLKPNFVALDEKTSYDQIRILMTCLKNAESSGPAVIP